MSTLDIVAICWTVLALVLVPSQLKTTAPYGRHARTDWGPSISNQMGWFLMELVSLVVFVGLVLFGPNDKTAPMWIFFALWAIHYINRSLIFPWRTKTRGKSMPIAIGERRRVQHRQCGIERALSRLVGTGVSGELAERSALHHRARDLRERRRDQHLVRQQADRPPR